jgi:hypothetical protein
MPLTLQYDLESSQGEELLLGNVRVSPETLSANLLPAQRLDSRLTRLLPPEQLQDLVFLFQWPENLMQEGVLEMISRTGRVLWSQNINAHTTSEWKAHQENWKEILLKAKFNKDEVSKLPIFKFQYGIRQANRDNTPFWNVQEPFRFCLSRQENLGLTRLCTFQYEVIRQKNQVRLNPYPMAGAPPRVIVMNESGKLAQEIEVPLEKPVQFYAELKSGLSYEFVAIPHKTQVVDMVQEKNGQIGTLTTIGDLSPLAPSVLLNEDKNPEWMEWVGWQQTIGDFRKYWKTSLPLKDAFVMLPGTGGGAFKQKFTITKLPREEIRPYTEVHTLKGTYIDGAPIRGRKPAHVQLSTSQNSVEVSENKENFVWSFGAKKRNEFNRSYLTVNDGENTFQSYHEVFKTYNREISARFTGILGTEGNLGQPKVTVMGELAFNYWFEDILGWTNYYTRQRWGVSAKAFQTLTDLELSGIKAPLGAYTADLKYRFNPGLWGRDETWGLMGGYQKVTYDFFDAEMAGLGFFWARSMPKVFEEMFNWVRFLDYPKWVDLEFIYYLAPLNNKIQMNQVGIGNWALNFHGQVLFTKNFFGEAGFGIKQYDFAQTTYDRKNRPISKGFSFTSSYGTIGCGFKF